MGRHVGIAWGLGLCLMMAACGTAAAASYALPVDLSGGVPPLEACYREDSFYCDPSITVEIKTGREHNCAYWVADVRLASPTQLRTYAEDEFKSMMYSRGERMAKKVDAVLAINGDFYSHTGSKYIFRQGRLYADTLHGTRDILAIDTDGDFHPVHLAQTEDLERAVDGKDLLNVLCFGPILVEDGKAVENVYAGGIAAEKGRQRICLAQAGPLHYKVICCAGPVRGNKGMTLEQFAALAAAQGVETAYNLDGGDSTMLFFHGKKLNALTRGTREISDIVYFASAFGTEAVQ